MGIVRVDSSHNQWQSRQHFGKRGMLGIESQIELLQITYTGADVSHLINGDGLAQSGSTGQHRHAQEQQASEKGGEIQAAGLNGAAVAWLADVHVRPGPCWPESKTKFSIQLVGRDISVNS